MKPATAPSVLSTAFYAFYDLHRPTYHAYAAAHLPPHEALITVTHVFELIAATWTTVVTTPRPSARAWETHTQAIARRTGRTPAPAEDTLLLHDVLRLSIGQIATITGTDDATVAALLAAGRRARRSLPPCRTGSDPDGGSVRPPGGRRTGAAEPAAADDGHGSSLQR
ncbi:hypothetical protein [Streptomyces sp. NPDC017940]|uniref:hypothetical protein n=1 Tax=Streptomyces sp. NPDC017940 TaxID=3365017 RepID=UPI0037920DF2